jgi:hypothetical protein
VTEIWNVSRDECDWDAFRTMVVGLWSLWSSGSLREQTDVDETVVDWFEWALISAQWRAGATIIFGLCEYLIAKDAMNLIAQEA